jgi:hypothetical protein
MNQTRFFLLASLLLLFSHAARPLHAAEAELPHTFSPGTPIRAAEVNANFEALAQSIDGSRVKLVDSRNLSLGTVLNIPNAFSATVFSRFELGGETIRTTFFVGRSSLESAVIPREPGTLARLAWESEDCSGEPNLFQGVESSFPSMSQSTAQVFPDPPGASAPTAFFVYVGKGNARTISMASYAGMAKESASFDCRRYVENRQFTTLSVVVVPAMFVGDLAEIYRPPFDLQIAD